MLANITVPPNQNVSVKPPTNLAVRCKEDSFCRIPGIMFSQRLTYFGSAGGCSSTACYSI